MNYHNGDVLSKTKHMRHRIPMLPAIVLLASALLAGAASGDAFTLDTENSIFAIVTHKSGSFAWLSHNHLIYAEDYDAELTIDGNDLSTVAFRIEFPAKNLVVSDAEGHKRWNPSVLEAGLLDKPLEKTSPKNRQKIRENMLSKKQLDAEQFPKIAAALTKVREDKAEEPGHTHTHLAAIEITLHGQTLTRDFPAKIALEEGTLHIEVTASCNFTDFGIEPYSALGGLIKNRDHFDVYVNLTATKTPVAE